MKQYKAFDNTGEHITFTAATVEEAHEKAQAMQHAPVRLEEVKATKKGAKTK
jgi:hypothetical protein